MKSFKPVWCLVLFCGCAQVARSEMPERPNFEELCEQSETVVRGKCISCSDQKQELNGRTYCPTIFDVTKCYKGRKELNKIIVLVPTGLNMNRLRAGDFMLPKYQNGADYYLFLCRHKNDEFVRIPLDDIWGERPYTPQEDAWIEEELKEQESPDRRLSVEDNLTYRIPDDAEEEIVTFSDNQNQPCSKIIRYKKNDALVGERGWYSNGEIAYEYAYKNGLRHGLAREWSQKGNLRRLCYYRKDRLHGYLLHWSGTNLEITCWLRGKDISQKQYMKECERNVTLPKLKLN